MEPVAVPCPPIGSGPARRDRHVLRGDRVGLLGIVSLATEVGTWYLARSAADNAADASAVAAALAVSSRSFHCQDAGRRTDSATDNGYTTGGAIMVTANIPPATGNFTTNPAAAEVLINVTRHAAPGEPVQQRQHRR